MRRLLAITAAMAASGLLVGLPAGPAAADSASGEATGGGSYSVQVSVTGSGVGSGGSLGQGAVGSSGGSVSVSSPCGYEARDSQQALEKAYGSKEDAMKVAALWGNKQITSWMKGVVANWGKSGTWYTPSCDGNASGWGNFFDNNMPVLVGPGGAAAPPTPKLPPEFLEEIAIKAMTLPTPGIGHNPSVGGTKTYVNIPGGTWFWVTPRMGVGTTRSVTASAAGASATVVATFNGTTFTSSGGAAPNSKLCPDGGKPYTRGATSSCFLSYVISSGRGAYTVTASSAWSAQVSSARGTRGLPGATMTGTKSVRVGEIQTVNR